MTTLTDLLAEHADHVELTGGVLHCAVSTAAAGGSLDLRRVGSVTAVLRSIPEEQENSTLRCVLLSGTGDSFCTGGNLKAFSDAENRGAFVTETAQAFHEFVLALVHAPVPVVAAVHGWAAGAGMSIACASDVVVGGPATKFRPAYPSIGFSPDGGLSWTLPRIVGTTRAKDLLLTDGVLDGEEALRAGLVSRLVPDERILREANQVAADLAAGPTGSLAAIKRLVHESTGRRLDEHLHDEASSIGARAASAEGAEGVAAFVERRSAVFPGAAEHY